MSNPVAPPGVVIRCPKCGEAMVEVNRELTCLRGGMGLSKVVEAALRQIVAEDPAPVPMPASQATVPIGGRWFCPADGHRMRETRRVQLCGKCGRHLPGTLVYQLIEVHEHEKW